MLTRFAARRPVLAALCFLPLLSATEAPAATPRRAAAGPAPAPLGDTVYAAINTELGTITVALDHAHAPLTVENFVRYIDTRRFDGMAFYRAMKLAWGDQPNGLIQTGLSGDPRKILKPVAHEPTSQTGILHKAGTLSMARFAPGTATSDFSILLSDMAGLDADPTSTDPDRQAGFAAFGHVVGGMDVVRRIWDSPTSQTKGEGVMRGQMLSPPIRVLTVRRVPAPPPAPAPVPATPAAAPTPAATPAP